MYDTILLSIDGSESAARATEHATTLADRFDCDLHALYVVDTTRYTDLPIDDLEDEEVVDDLEEQGQRALQDVTDRPDAGTVTTSLRHGRPNEEIDDYADEIDADVVVLGHRGLGSPAEPRIGSVAERVVRTATRPVLIA